MHQAISIVKWTYVSDAKTFVLTKLPNENDSPKMQSSKCKWNNERFCFLTSSLWWAFPLFRIGHFVRWNHFYLVEMFANFY